MSEACPYCGAFGSFLKASGSRAARYIGCTACGQRGPVAATYAMAWAEFRQRFGQPEKEPEE